MEFLVQYDTESIIVDWHRVLTDTIRQLVRSLLSIVAFTWSNLWNLKWNKENNCQENENETNNDGRTKTNPTLVTRSGLNHVIRPLLMLYPRSTRTTLLTRRTETCTTRSPIRIPTSLEAAPTNADVGCTVDVTSFDPVGTPSRVSINVWNFSANRQSVTHSSSSAGDTDQKRVRTKLMKFLMKRPTLQSVKEKGYIRGKNCIFHYTSHINWYFLQL